MGDIFAFDDNFDCGLFEGAHVAFGVFDGFHRGHQHLVNSMLSRAGHTGGRSVVLTFDIDPDELFRGSELHKLMTNDKRLATLAGQVDAVVVLPFDKKLAALEPDEFLLRTFKEFAPVSLHVGTDFHFGACARGTVDDLQRWSESSGAEILAYELAEYAGAPVTASRIRKLLGECRLSDAVDLLGHAYSVEGVVEHGRAEGRDMGFATANLTIPDLFRTLGDGVYAAYTLVDGARYKVAVSMGVTPTFDQATANCEAHVLNYTGDLYGRTLELEFAKYLRPMIRFERVEDLIATVQSDIQWIQQNL